MQEMRTFLRIRGAILYCVNREHSDASVFSPMKAVAAISLLALGGAIVWVIKSPSIGQTVASQQEVSQTADVDQALQQWIDSMHAIASGTAMIVSSSTDPISNVSNQTIASLVGAYAGLQQQGVYSTDTAAQIAATIATNAKAPVVFKVFTAAEIKTDPDTSYARMLTYRADIQKTLKPLRAVKQPEFELFAKYVDTNDATYLNQLSQEAQDYQQAASSTALISVPKDLVTYHVDILNALEEFAAVLNALVAHANDPIASSLLLQNYNNAESHMFTAFNAITQYEKSKSI